MVVPSLTSMPSRIRTLGLLPLLTILLGTSVRADPIPLVSGPANLSTSGLLIDLPKKKGVTYMLSASWALNSDTTFDGRDVVDEKVGDKLVAGSWVMVGWFTAGDCMAVVKAADLENTWERPALKLWGATFAARGGVFTFDGSLGKKPAMALCLNRGDRKQLLLYRFFLDQPTDMTEAQMLKEIPKAAVLERAYRAFAKDKLALGEPLSRPEVRNRGKIEAARALDFPGLSFGITLPNDGAVWLKGEGPDKIDQLDRMVPAIPEITVEMARFDEAESCQEAFDALTATQTKVKLDGVPSGWEVGPRLTLEGGTQELTLCHKVPWGALIVGVFVQPLSTDVSTLAKLLDTLAAAADKAPAK